MRRKQGQGFEPERQPRNTVLKEDTEEVEWESEADRLLNADWLVFIHFGCKMCSWI